MRIHVEVDVFREGNGFAENGQSIKCYTIKQPYHQDRKPPKTWVRSC